MTRDEAAEELEFALDIAYRYLLSPKRLIHRKGLSLTRKEIRQWH